MSEMKPRFFGNEPLGDGVCSRVYLGDDLAYVLSLMKDLNESLNDALVGGEKIEIWVEELTDEQVESLPEL